MIYSETNILLGPDSGLLNIMTIYKWNTYIFNLSISGGKFWFLGDKELEKTIIPFIICHLSSIDEMCRDRFVKKKFHFLSSSHQVFVTRLHILFVCKGLERPSINKCSMKTELKLSFRCTYIVLLPRLRKSCFFSEYVLL